VILGAVGALLALAGLLLPGRSRMWAAGALVLSVVSAGAGVPEIMRSVGSAAQDEPTVTSPPATVTDPDATIISYEITTDGMSVTHLSYVDLVDGEPQMVEKLGTPPPFRHAIRIPEADPWNLTDFSVTGLGGSTSTTTTCTLTVDGEIVATQTALGSYGVVSCAG